MFSKKSLLAVFLAITSSFVPAADAARDQGSVTRPATDAAPLSKEKVMRIRFMIEGKVAHATLENNATARDFASLLPMTLTLEDYARTEKIHYLPRKLSTAGAPAGADPSLGDIAYYAPWGNLVVYYRDFAYSAGLVRLGRVESGLELMSIPGALKATIEVVPD